MTADSPTTHRETPAVLRVLRGSPSSEELAAATAALLGLLRRRTPNGPVADSPRPTGWDRPQRSTHRVAGSWRR